MHGQRIGGALGFARRAGTGTGSDRSRRLAGVCLGAVLAWTPIASAGDLTEARAIEPEGLVGLRAPACELTPLARATVASSEGAGANSTLRADGDATARAAFVRRFEGRVVLVDFWASWCPTCEHAFGFLNSLAEDYRSAGLEVLAINLDSDPRDARDFLAGRRVAFDVAHDATGRCPRGFGLVGMPSAYLIDASGRVRAVTRGFRAGEARALRGRIEALLAETPEALPAVAAGRAAPARSADPGPSAPR